MSSHREQLIDFFNAGVNAVVGDNAVIQHLSSSPLMGKCYAIAMGKAASAMLNGALKSLSGQIVEAVKISV